MKKKKSIANTIWIVILTIAALAWIYPIIMILMNSLKKESAISTGTAFKLPTADAFAGIANQMSKKASEVIEGEKLDLLIGNSPLDKAEGLDEEEKETIKANVLHILKENYGIEEEDFASAELEIVPAGKARDCGFDRSMILSYGQDDRVCAFTSLFAMLDVEKDLHAACSVRYLNHAFTAIID